MIVALAALAAAEIEFERDRVAHRHRAPPRSRPPRSSARPRLVCSTVPVRLKTGRRLGALRDLEPRQRRAPQPGPAAGQRRHRARAAASVVAHRGDDRGAAEPRRCVRRRRPVRSTSSTEGSLRSVADSALGHARLNSRAGTD